jgi:hypothetical protein
MDVGVVTYPVCENVSHIESFLAKTVESHPLSGAAQITQDRPETGKSLQINSGVNGSPPAKPNESQTIPGHGINGRMVNRKYILPAYQVYQVHARPNFVEQEKVKIGVRVNGFCPAHSRVCQNRAAHLRKFHEKNILGFLLEAGIFEPDQSLQPVNYGKKKTYRYSNPVIYLAQSIGIHLNSPIMRLTNPGSSSPLESNTI